MQSKPLSADARDALIEAPDDVLLRQVEVERFRASGPGGQHRNKVETGVRIRHREAGIVVTATERRSQHENRAKAIKRLRRALATGVRSEAVDRDKLPAAVIALLESGRWPNLSPKSQGFWLLAARVLDRLAADGARLSDSARSLDVSTASLSKFLGRDDTLWQAACRIRAAAGLGPLRK